MIKILQNKYQMFLTDLRKSGDSSSWLDKMASLEETNNALGLEEINDRVNKIRANLVLIMQHF